VRALKIPSLSWKGRTVLVFSAVSAAGAAGLTLAAWHFVVLAVSGSEHPALLVGLIDRFGGAVAGPLCAFLMGGLANKLGEALLQRWRRRSSPPGNADPFTVHERVVLDGDIPSEQRSRWHASENVLRN
jgi:hypothetical protein